MSIFRSEAVLLPEFIPDKPVHREAQLGEVAECVKPILAGRRAENVFLYGLPGTGKTTCMRYMLSELREQDPHLLCLYVNAWRFNTRLSILSLIAEKMKIVFPRRGIAGDELLERIVEISQKEKTKIVIAIDEVDQLTARGESGLLYDLSRGKELYGMDIAIICASNDAAAVSNFDSRIKSSLAPRRIEFTRYSPLELKDILRERAKLSFSPNSCSDEVIALCAAHAAKNGGDARLALQCLWAAGRDSENFGLDYIGVENVKKILAIAGVEKGSLKKAELKELGEVEKQIIAVLKKFPDGISSGELYAELKEKNIEERTARNHLLVLEKTGLISVKETQGASGKGKSRMISLSR